MLRLGGAGQFEQAGARREEPMVVSHAGVGPQNVEFPKCDGRPMHYGDGDGDGDGDIKR